MYQIKHPVQMPKDKNKGKVVSDEQSGESSANEADYIDVEKVIDSRVKAGKTQYLLKWKGYSE